MEPDKSEQALSAYLNFFRMEEHRKRIALQKRHHRIVFSAVSVAAMLLLAVTISLHLVQKEDHYVVYLHGKKLTNKEFALKLMTESMSDLPTSDQSVGEQLSNVFEALATEGK